MKSKFLRLSVLNSIWVVVVIGVVNFLQSGWLKQYHLNQMYPNLLHHFDAVLPGYLSFLTGIVVVVFFSRSLVCRDGLFQLVDEIVLECDQESRRGCIQRWLFLWPACLGITMGFTQIMFIPRSIVPDLIALVFLAIVILISNVLFDGLPEPVEDRFNYSVTFHNCFTGIIIGASIASLIKTLIFSVSLIQGLMVALVDIGFILIADGLVRLIARYYHRETTTAYWSFPAKE